MSQYDDLITRLLKVCNGTATEAAYALAAQAAEIARLTGELSAEKDETFRLQCSHSKLYGEVQELKADAQRYRWLRSARGDEMRAAKYALMVCVGGQMDAAIDAAFAPTQESKT